MSSERIGYTISSGSLITSGITAGNINFTGSLYQNGSVYSPSTSLKGFQVSATAGNAFTPYVAVGDGTNTIAYSSDGITWTGLGTSIFSSIGYGVAYNGTNRWVAVGNGTNSIAYSSDGISWTGIGTSIFLNTGYGVVSNGSTTSSLIVSGQRVQYDTNNNYNNTTGTFTAPSSGIYTINLNGLGNCYITSANTFIPTTGNYTTNAYISAGNTLKCVVSGGVVYNWGVSYL